MIRNIQDLAAHLGAYDDTSKAIARRVYKDTSAGCPAGVERVKVGERDVTYVVQCALSVLGYKVLTWRLLHGKRKYAYKEPMPPGLADYLLVGEQRIGRAPVLCSDGLEPTEVSRLFGRAWMRDKLTLDERLLKKTHRGPLTVYLTVKVKEPIIGDYFFVTGYCEGSDQEHEVYYVSFPCSPDAIGEAIGQAEQDSQETWDATHGCDKCHPEGTCDEWGNAFAPGELGAPINPDCPSCEGAGIVL